jgi:hypothetical protein
MIITYPISKHDAHLAPALAKAIVVLGKNESHTALVVASPEVRAEAQDFLDTIAPMFGDVRMEVMAFNPHGGWPLAPNQQFLFAAKSVLAIEGNQPWLWHEMDACPSRPGWADFLTVAYQTGERRFMGFTKPTTFLHQDGTTTTDGSTYLSGVAVYPHNIYTDIEPIRGIGRTNMAFDVFLRHEMKARGIHHTNAIQHRWRTAGYRWDGLVLTMENDPDGDIGIPREDPLPIKPADTCIIHGCLDGSLARAIIEEYEEVVDGGAMFLGDEEPPAPKRRTRAKKELVEA